jgi:small nuclear ribonucleoprotein (snRNP)-like protein
MGEQYQKMNDRNVFKNNDKPRRYDEDDLNKSLIGKNVKVSLVDGRTLSGTLCNLGVFDLSVTTKTEERLGALIRDTVKKVIVMKASIVTIEMV